MSKAYVASHAILFEDDTRARAGGEPPDRCDVCGESIPDDDVFSATAPAGRGLFLSTRGGEVRYEEPPLCASCGTAIGVIALAQWDIEEEEG
jgi:hypothetical protein